MRCMGWSVATGRYFLESHELPSKTRPISPPVTGLRQGLYRYVRCVDCGMRGWEMHPSLLWAGMLRATERPVDTGMSGSRETATLSSGALTGRLLGRAQKM